jgi:ABC-2 type transport system permease protein
MNRWRQVLEVARREFVQRARSRAFQITMLLTLGIIVAMGPILLLIQDESPPVRVGIVGEQPEGFRAAVEAQAAALGTDVEVSSFGSIAGAESALVDGTVDVLLVDGTELVWQEESSVRITSIVSGALLDTERRAAIAELGLTDEEVARLLVPVPLSERVLVVEDPEETPRRIGALAGMFVLYMSILIFGQFVAMGIVEEKQNRVVEVVLSRIKPAQLLVGKVLGIGALGLLQVLAIGAAAVVALTFVDLPDVSLAGLGAEIIASVVFWYLLGFTLYSFLYAALGATVSRQEDLQGAVILPLFLILPGFFLAQVAVEFPDGTLATVGSLVPFWTPMVMPVRMASGGVPWSQVALSVALVALTIVVLVRVGARVYSGAVLRTGARVKLRDAWKGARG